jgi:hypothetical protein
MATAAAATECKARIIAGMSRQNPELRKPIDIHLRSIGVSTVAWDSPAYLTRIRDFGAIGASRLDDRSKKHSRRYGLKRIIQDAPAGSFQKPDRTHCHFSSIFESSRKGWCTGVFQHKPVRLVRYAG